jgi:hypothetical protein
VTAEGVVKVLRRRVRGKEFGQGRTDGWGETKSGRWLDEHSLEKEESRRKGGRIRRKGRRKG